MKNPFDSAGLVDNSSPPSPSKSDGSLASSPVTHCSICAQSGSISPTDPLLVCTDCGVCVHFSCYGEGFEGANGWRCRWCASPSKKTKACVFCPFTEGAFVSVSNGRWAHVICCLFIPEVSFVDPHSMTLARIPLDDSFKTLQRKTCTICDKQTGVCRRCDDDRCDTYFHVTCAQALGFLLFDHQSDDRIKFSAYCQSHRSAYKTACHPSHRWLSENSSALSAMDVNDPNSATRRIVKKIIYRLAKELSKTCPHAGTKGSEVNGWYNEGCQRFFELHPNLNRKGVSSYIRSCGLGFYHGCLRRKFAPSKMTKSPSKAEGGADAKMVVNGKL